MTLTVVFTKPEKHLWQAINGPWTGSVTSQCKETKDQKISTAIDTSFTYSLNMMWTALCWRPGWDSRRPVGLPQRKEL